MYVQVVTYGLDMSESEYLDVAHELAPAFAGMPGLAAKIWLEDLDLGRYGAVYFWDDRESMERFLRSDLFEGTNPEFVDVESEGFGILENLTAQTQPVLELVQPRPAGGRKAVGTAARTTPAVAQGATTTAAAPRKAPAAKTAAKKPVAKKAPATKASTKKTTAKKATAKKTAG